MERYASERLIEVFEALLPKSASLPIGQAFKGIWPGYSSMNAQIAVGYLFQDAISELTYCKLNERPRSRALAKVKGCQSEFHSALNNASFEAFKKQFSMTSAIEELQDVTDILETGGLPRSKQIYRESLATHTRELLVDIEAMDLPSEVVLLARINLVAVEQLIKGSVSASDTMIALSVKSVVADLLIALEPYSEVSPSIFEKIKEYGRKGTYGTLFTLALVADGSAVYDLLPGGETIALLEAPSKQITDQTDEILAGSE